MLRVHFTAEDLTRVRVSAAVDPLWETLLAAHLLQKSDAEVLFGRWRRRARGEAAAFGGLLRLMPPYGYCPDFLTPATGTVHLREGVEAVMSAPKTRIAHELTRLGGAGRLPGSAALLAEGDPATLRRLGAAITGFHDAVLAPHWPQINATVAADRNRRAADLMSGGVDRLLRTVVPGATWTPPVWQVPFPLDDDLYLDGRGLTLTPTFFCLKHPTRLLDPEHPPVLAYPANPRPGWLTETGPAAGLGELLGATRAAALYALAGESATTTGLAARLGISPPTASQHARTLREAGLLVTVRAGKAVLHHATDLGRALLERH
ncbi:transcriptional regulator [Actinorhabdospora filicis]|uniref:Transcriptional regulator n=1 Tax=Actinorhabdospora filicis TaxID=1785913 RepID=A0A9W6SQD0_9ACTN|nr:winged helix-turn-helix domain-containing protein [Actinorhabdospora filicis]GLZ80232.1 transcriptional regulator [Actinorhabdospora filicis]